MQLRKYIINIQILFQHSNFNIKISYIYSYGKFANRIGICGVNRLQNIFKL